MPGGSKHMAEALEESCQGQQERAIPLQKFNRCFTRSDDFICFRSIAFTFTHRYSIVSMFNNVCLTSCLVNTILNSNLERHDYATRRRLPIATLSSSTVTGLTASGHAKSGLTSIGAPRRRCTIRNTSSILRLCQLQTNGNRWQPQHYTNLTPNFHNHRTTAATSKCSVCRK